jgi:hypothetical protein
MHLKHKSACGGCQHTVMMTYLELLELGTSPLYAYQTCVTLYRICYPATSKDDAQSVVTRWIEPLSAGKGTRLSSTK